MTSPAKPDDPIVSTASLDVVHRSAPLCIHIVRPPLQDPAVVLFSHGDAGLDGASYAPLFRIWAQHGLAILAPHHAKTDASFWHTRVQDMQALWRSIALIEAQLPGPPCRLGRAAPRVAGHSFGGHTAALLLGARPRIATPPDDTLALKEALSGVLLAPPGDGGPENLTAEWAVRAPYLDLDWSGLDRPFMTVAGMRDVSPMSSRDWQWHTDAFHNARSANKTLAVAPEGDHYLGGIAIGRGVPDTALLGDVGNATALYLGHQSKLIRPHRLLIYEKLPLEDTTGQECCNLQACNLKR